MVTIPNFSPLLDLLKQSKNIRCSGVPDSVDSFLTFDIYQKNSTPILFVTGDQKEAERLVSEINGLQENRAKLFPIANSVPYNMRSPFGPTREARLQLLKSLLAGETSIIVAPATTLFEATLPPQKLFNSVIRLAVGDDIEPSSLISWLTTLGFKRENSVADPGSFAMRGGILDVYSFGLENPIRIEFWGDTIDSIREFDIFRQKSLKSIPTVEFIPMKEFLPTAEERDTALMRVERFVANKRIDKKLHDLLIHSWGSLSETDGLEWFTHWFDFQKSSLLEYLPQNTLCIWSDFLSLEQRFEREVENYQNHTSRVPEMQVPFVSSPKELLLAVDVVKRQLKNFSHLYLRGGERETPSAKFDFITQPSFGGDIPLLIHDISKKLEDGYDITIIAETEGHLKRMREHLEGKVLSMPQLFKGHLENGFFSVSQKSVYYSEAKLFDRITERKFSARTKQSAPIISYDALNRGDIVVHIDHGIGKYQGIVEISVGETQQDCMIIEYRENAKIHVPITDFHKVQKYIGRDSYEPQLSKLGSSAWEKKKERTRRDLQEMASKMIKLYAKRDFEEGVAVGEDTSWQEEFEEAFLYTPTPDQEKSLVDIKQDMESNRPMDRLVCGDVGFGKTEVAMRAAFKAVMDGYQVAILAPTTVLAAQHGKSFKERMSDFPVNIGTLSRLTNSDAVRRIKSGAASGDLNIIVGTHKILSKSIKYDNLGLVIIDEEQRFGVKQKERFTELRHSINVLSMSATPIPRTLHMSMAGIRDLSTIATPPQNRLPVETTVAESHDDLMQRAICDEIDRGGQTFIVLNRIGELDALYKRVERLVPNGRIAIAHGQMEGDHINEIMGKFRAGEYDILLSTTIIENGIDISNANTIIVERADMLGLSQLYQLRGRVGRSSQQGFAYFFVDSFKKVKDDSMKRLKALEQYTDLGSGFQLAMRDLELRGAGNLLGTDQSGSIAGVGFELYCQLLKEEMDRLRNRRKEDMIIPDPELKIGLQGHFPSSYIADSNLRIRLYQECTSLKSLDAAREFETDLVDRFGALPQEVAELILFMEIKILAKHFYIERVEKKGQILSLLLTGSQEQVQKVTAQFMGLKEGNFTMQYGEKITLRTKLPKADDLPSAETIRNILKHVLYSEKPEEKPTKKKKKIIKKKKKS